jgi:anti-sigma B factor antagonist
MSEWDVGFERSEHEGRAMLAVSGEIDLSVANRLRQELETLVADSNGTGLVDLSGVSFIDSSGIRELLTARLAAQNAGGELVLMNPSASCRRVLEVSGVLSEFTVRQESG